MRGILLKEYNANIIRALFDLNIAEKPTPQPKANQVLIKMSAAPVNPSDIAFIRGMYNIKKTLPVFAGFEGTGTVVETGDEPLAKSLKGKRVSCFSQTDGDGTWADYYLTSAENCLPIIEDLSVEQAACFFINPFTAFALYNKIISHNPAGIVQNAATGQVGRFIRFFAKQDNIPVINIVRKQKHVEELKSNGEKFVICSSSENFLENAKSIFNNYTNLVFIDAVGGSQTGEVLNILPQGSTVIVYGGLSGTDISSIDPLHIIFHRKTITGFNLNEWFADNSREEILIVSEKLQKMIVLKQLETKINKSFPLSEAKNAIKTYISDMSAGKVLFDCNI
ncbi:MAG: zinc-binding dehydrogenase [Marinilabiliales bacterium]